MKKGWNMFNKDDYEIKKINKEGVQLKGYHLKANDQKCVVAFAGFAGNCDKLFCNIADHCGLNEVSFLFGNTRGSYETKDLKTYLEDGSCVKKTYGACYENFDDTISDMVLWLDYAVELGYKEICLVGASIACNKIVKLLNNYNNEKIKKVVLLCPQDIQTQLDEKMLEEAKLNIKNNEPEKVLSDKFFGFCDVCGRTYYDMATRADINNIPYLSQDGNFEMFSNINLPILGIIGSKDQGLGDLDATSCMEKIRDNNENFKFEVIDDAKHTFKHHEDEVSDLIINYIK